MAQNRCVLRPGIAATSSRAYEQEEQLSCSNVAAMLTSCYVPRSSFTASSHSKEAEVVGTQLDSDARSGRDEGGSASARKRAANATCRSSR